MGQTRDHVCSACGYRANVSGGPDAGEMCETLTVVCQQCRALYDVVTAEHGRDAAPPNRNSVKPSCPKSASHVVKPWKKKDRCPKCGGSMKIDPEGEHILWD